MALSAKVKVVNLSSWEIKNKMIKLHFKFTANRQNRNKLNL